MIIFYLKNLILSQVLTVFVEKLRLAQEKMPAMDGGGGKYTGNFSDLFRLA